MGILSGEDSVRRRAPRKRASRSNVRSTRNTAAREAVPKKEPPKIVEREERISKAPERKAPTPIASTKASKKKRQKQLATAFVVLVLGIGTSAAIGFSDKGQIDVQKTIEQRNERIKTGNLNESDVNTETVAIPVQNTNKTNKADGGLVGAGKKAPSPPPVVASTTATSSDQTASSTDVTASSTEEVQDDATEEETSTDPEV